MTDPAPADNAATPPSAASTQSWPGEPAPAPPPLPGKSSTEATAVPGSYRGSDEPSTWPKTFGIISLALAGASIVYGPLMAWQQSRGSSSGMGDMGEYFSSLPPWYGTYLWTVTLISIAEALLLLLPAALLLFKRRRLSVKLHLAYAAVAALTTVVSTIIMFVALEDARSTMDPFMAHSAQTGAIMGGVYGLAYPGVLLWWFLRPKIRKETATWTR